MGAATPLLSPPLRDAPIIQIKKIQCKLKGALQLLMKRYG